jgi:hypothetical protein
MMFYSIGPWQAFSTWGLYYKTSGIHNLLGNDKFRRKVGNTFGLDFGLAKHTSLDKQTH